MAFVTINPSKGTTALRTSVVTVSWRQRSNKPGLKNRAFYLAVYVGQGIARELGWTEKLKLRAAYCADTNRLMLERAPGGEKAFSAHCRNGTICVNVPLAHVEREAKPAANVHHSVAQPASGAQLLLTLPPWSWEPGKQRAREARERVEMSRGQLARTAA